jgi:hypothetical protein
MSRLVFDGNYKVYWLDTAPADPAAPTVTEVAAGTDITPSIPKDGFKPGVSNNRVSGGSLDELFLDESMGTWSSQLSVDYYLDAVTADNTAHDTFVQGATGAIVAIWDGTGNTALAKAYVWPDVECGQPIPADTAENARQKATAEFAVRQAPNFHAILAAGA